ncbi:MAG: transglutaminase domain-containing protein [Ardenticatenaceae bacterium]|nr:transglutaminase domain-containing protein [Anaerolineales bacterium]MCB8923889.1 transglutaminase domain-containing protein [Ardenticatenaceae bacterium]MCB8990466.1 transglutaminase domain-containing protein [Ardenticatenaceae bacterium]MCB9003480.1 transglutaminase domain-containing protein [Ardenticatenaceae bacterium]
MFDRLFSYVWNRYRPTEGWAVLGLLLMLVVTAAMAVSEANWVAEDTIVPVAAVAGLLMGMLLAKRPLSPTAAWIFLALYGLLFNGVGLGKLLPPFSVWRGGWRETSAYWREAGALLFDRTASWFAALFGGGRSNETIVFALGLGLTAWLLAAFAAWSVYRLQRPLAGVVVMGLALAVNGYFGDATQWLPVYVGLTVLLLALANLALMQRRWTETAVDYSNEIQLELTFYAMGVAMTLVALTVASPVSSFRKWAAYLAQQPIVQEIDQTWDRLFGGVASPDGPGSGPGWPGGSGVMPRAYLLGNAPELSETVVMTAVVTSATTNQPITGAEMTGLHWRGLSYQVYTGRGWTISEERREELPAGQAVSLPPLAEQTQYWQTVYWLLDERVLRYTLGFPLQFDEPVTLHWRGLTDFVRVQGHESTYTMLTTRATAVPNLLRASHVSNVPATVLARYTALPDNVPQRVLDLAQDVAGGFNNPYDQARALEQFLRQYAYSLDVAAPPADADVVEYFLFEAQQGYCDYYASAMVVMARSLGLPARMAVGFAAQEPDAAGRQVVRQINGHSWAEVYFADMGWVEFEPTAGFVLPNEAETAVPTSDETPSSLDELVPPPLPAQDAPSRPFSRWWLVLFAGVGVAGVWWWQARRLVIRNVVDVYGRFQQQAVKLGAPPQASQTPHEFADHFLQGLRPLAQHPRLAKWVEVVQEPVQRLTAVFERVQYSQDEAGEGDTAVAQSLWQRLRQPMVWLRLFRRMK